MPRVGVTFNGSVKYLLSAKLKLEKKKKKEMENVLRRFNPWVVSNIIRMDLKDVETSK